MANQSAPVPSNQSLALLKDLPVVNNNTDLKRTLDQLEASCNILVQRQINFASPLHKVALEVIMLNPDPNGPDVYSPDKGKSYTFHYKALNKFAGTAGLTWTASRPSGPPEVDKDGKITFIAWEVGWEIVRPNGVKRRGLTSGSYRYVNDASLTAGQREQRQRFAMQHAESNAKLRAIFEALEQLPRQFTLEDMRKPFIVPVVVDAIGDMIQSDQRLKELYVTSRLGLEERVFGPAHASPAVDAHYEDTPRQEAAQEAVAQPTTSGAVEAAQIMPTHTFVPKYSETEYREGWTKAPLPQRQDQLKKLLEEKGETWPATNTKGQTLPTFESLTPERQVDALWYYYSLPGKEPQAAMPWENK